MAKVSKKKDSPIDTNVGMEVSMLRDAYFQLKKAEKDAQESKNFLDKVINTMSDPVFVKDDQSRFVLVNEAMVNLTGLSREDQIGNTSFELYPKKEVDVFLQNDRKVLKTGKESISEEQLTNKMGNTFTVVTKKTRYVDVYGKKFIVGVIRDITDKKKAEDTLLKSEEKLNLIFNSSPVGICTVDMLGNFVTTNLAYERIVGYDKEELVGLSFFDVTHPSDRPKNKKLFQGMFSLETTGFSMEKRYVRKNGEEINVSVHAIGVIGDDGDVKFGTAFVEDITEKKKAEEVLNTFKIAVERSSDAMEISASDGKRYYQNKAFDELFGDIGSDAPSSVYVDKKVGREVFKTVVAGRDWNGEVEMYGKGKKIFNILLRAYPLKDNNNKVIALVGVHTDITDIRETQDILEENRELLNTVGEIAKIGGWEMDLVSGSAKWTKATYDIVEIGYNEPIPGPNEHIEYYLPKYRPMIAKAMSDLIKHNKPLDFEAEFKTKKGKIGWIRVIGRQKDVVKGKCVKINGTLQDITEMKKVEAEIKFKNVLLSTQQEVSLDGIFVVDEKGVVISANQRFFDLWNVPMKLRKSKEDKTLLKYMNNQMSDPDEFLKRVTYLYKNKNKVSQEEISLKDGRFFDRYSAPMLDPEKRYFGRVWFFRDVTEQKKSEEALKKKVEQMEFIFRTNIKRYKRTLELEKDNKTLREDIEKKN